MNALLYFSLGVSYRKSVKNSTTESIQNPNHPSIGGNENLFSIVAECDSGPVTNTSKQYLKVGKWTLSQKDQIYQLKCKRRYIHAYTIYLFPFYLIISTKVVQVKSF